MTTYLKTKHDFNELIYMFFSGWQTAVSCGYPGYLRFGTLEGTRYKFGNIVKATCMFGYRLEGSAERTCHEDGKWSGDQASCQGKYYD